MLVWWCVVRDLVRDMAAVLLVSVGWGCNDVVMCGGDDSGGCVVVWWCGGVGGVWWCVVRDLIRDMAAILLHSSNITTTQ